MKKLSNLMLAAVATAALASPAMAWDFGVTGSASATFNQTTTKTSSDGDAVSKMEVGSESGAITLSSKNTDGDNSVSFSYKLDWDGNMDEIAAVSGSTKVGNWTGSSSIDYNLDRNTGGFQADEDRPVITLTDGTMTVNLGNAVHLSTAGNTSDSAASGAVNMGFSDAGIGAYVDEYQAVSVGYKVDENTNVTFAYQADQDATIFGRGTAGANEGDNADGYSTSGFGINVAASVGADVSFTYATGATSLNNAGDNDSIGTSKLTTMGLGVGLDMDGIAPFFSYGSAEHVASTTIDNKTTTTAMGLGATVALGGGDSVVVSYTTSTQKNDADGTTGRDATATGIELGYGTTVGPVALKVGYGSKSVSANTGGWNNDGTDEGDGYSMTDIEVNMSYSF